MDKSPTPGELGYNAGLVRAKREQETNNIQTDDDAYFLYRGIVFGVMAIVLEKLGPESVIKMASEVEQGMFNVATRNGKVPAPKPLKPFLD